jgi:hypothetical protein
MPHLQKTRSGQLRNYKTYQAKYVEKYKLKSQYEGEEKKSRVG